MFVAMVTNGILNNCYIIDDCILDYLEVNDNMITSLMMRHRTLSDTNTTLVENLTGVQDEVRNS